MIDGLPELERRLAELDTEPDYPHMAGGPGTDLVYFISAEHPTAAERDVELAILSAMAHGNGPQGLAVLQAAFGALGRLDREHAAVYFQIIWNMLREPMRRALEALVERQTEGKATFPPFAQQLIERGKLEGLQQGKLEGRREALLRFIARAGITLTENDHARIHACDDVATLDRWSDNVLGAKTASDILS
jgi:hypothetical protein